jgi:hypothetical protein
MNRSKCLGYQWDGGIMEGGGASRPTQDSSHAAIRPLAARHRPHRGVLHMPVFRIFPCAIHLKCVCIKEVEAAAVSAPGYQRVFSASVSSGLREWQAHEVSGTQAAKIAERTQFEGPAEGRSPARRPDAFPAARASGENAKRTHFAAYG